MFFRDSLFRIMAIIKLVVSFLVFLMSLDTPEPKIYKATYYADKFNGRRTASGHIFSNGGLSVATSDAFFFKKTITFVAVKTKKIIKLYCNDFMHPRMKGKVDFDLTRKAMRDLTNSKNSYSIPGNVHLSILSVE